MNRINGIIKFGFVCLLSVSWTVYAQCQSDRVKVQVLGSGGPELDDERASSSYLVWLDDRAKVMVDTGSGSSLNFEKSNTQFNDIDVIVFSHFHVDHSADFAAYIKSAYFSNRSNDLKVFGPEGNSFMPSASKFVQRMVGEEGAYPYLSDYLLTEEKSPYKIIASNISLKDRGIQLVYKAEQFVLQAIPVHHGPIPALAWRITLAGCSVTFSGDMSNQYQTLKMLAKESELLIAHNAIPENLQGVGRKLHMPPSEIGKIAKQANVKKLILSHRMKRTLGKEQSTIENIKRYFKGDVEFADDLDLFSLTK